MSNERVHFRLIRFECCGYLFCNINPRLPTHCPECGVLAYPMVKSWIVFEDQNAVLKHK